MIRRSALRRLTPLVTRTALRTYTALKPGGPLPHRSTRRAAEEREFRRRREAYMAGHDVCELCEEAPSRELHHKRGRVGADLIDTDHFAALCGACHRWATENPAAAIRLGISEPRIGRTAG